MELIREQLIYKNVPTMICMKKLKPIEQYEVIRLLLATRTDGVSICTHECTNIYIDTLLKQLPLKFVQCFREEFSILVFPPTDSDSSLTVSTANGSGEGSNAF